MKGLARKAIKHAEAAGYRFERENTKGFRFYRAASGHEVGISPGLDDRGCRLVMQQVDRACGIGPDLSRKRNPAAIKAEQERTRDLLREEKRRHQTRLDQLARERQDALLAGVGCELSMRQVLAIEKRIEQERREHRATVQQMTAVPASSA